MASSVINQRSATAMGRMTNGPAKPQSVLSTTNQSKNLNTISEHSHGKQPNELANRSISRVSFSALKDQSEPKHAQRPHTAVPYDKPTKYLSNESLSKSKQTASTNPLSSANKSDFRSPRIVKPRSAFFYDGYRPIDFMLAFKPMVSKKKRTINAQFRQKFEMEMKNSGLELESEPKEKSPDQKTAFTKVHATWAALSRQAEFEQLQMPVAENGLELRKHHFGRRMLEKIFKRDPFRLSEEFELPVHRYFTDDFSRDDEEKFLMDSPDRFFTSHQRVYLTWSIISNIQIKLQIRKKTAKKKKADDDPLASQEDEEQRNKPTMIEKSANIMYLLGQGIYTNAFPLHDSDFDPHPEDDDDYIDYSKIPVENWPLRKYLYESWAKWTNWRKYQPIDKIREYYGEKIGLYFAWIGFYTHMLVLPSIIGVIVFIVGIALTPINSFAEWFCQDGIANPFVFCRSCPNIICQYTTLAQQCNNALLTVVFDYSGATIYSMFMAIWIVVFLRLWIRYQSELAQRWDVSDRELSVENVRPDFNLKVETTWINPVTKEVEPHLPERSVQKRVIGSIATVVFFLAVVMSLLIAVMSYKALGPIFWYAVLTTTELDGSTDTMFSPTLMTSVTSSVLNGFCIALMNKLYGKVCWRLTHMEMHRSETQFEYSYTYKMFLFQFVNFYGALFYLSFIRPFVPADPTVDNASDIIQVPPCAATGCLLDVTIQLIIIMTGKQILNNGLELGLPLLHNLKRKWTREKASKKTADTSELTRWEKDIDLENQPPIPLFGDYLEMLLQYGFVTMFVPAFPLAPLLALINNIVEIRLDAYKMLTQTKRFIPVRANSLGPWYELLEIVSKLAIFTNAMLIAFTSGFIDRVVVEVPVIPNATWHVTFMDNAIVPFQTSTYCNRTSYGLSEFDTGTDQRFNAVNCVRLQYLSGLNDDQVIRTYSLIRD